MVHALRGAKNGAEMLGSHDACFCEVGTSDLTQVISFTLDTGCSSSLYALHQAVSALDANECDAAIVCASNLLQSPEQQLGTMKAGVLSPTGICHTFDDQADGYGRADGVGALYLKKLSKAIKDGDPIRSIVRGTAVNA